PAAGPPAAGTPATDASPVGPSAAQPPGAGRSADAGASRAPAARPRTDDPHPAILSAAHAGRHGEAAAIVSLWESAALRAHGPGSPEAIHWLEVRADLARIGQDPGRSCELWISAAEARLGLRQAPEDPEVRAAADRAHHQWTQLASPERAGELAPALTALRERVPGTQPGALQAIRERLDALYAAAPESR
ncbi:hypothetical protein G5C65_16975, partial [Streptomyces sp. SB3404]|nr:hypothetical protein [Streptomyces boncukensis]